MVLSSNRLLGRGGILSAVTALLFFSFPLLHAGWMPDGHLLKWGMIWFAAGLSAFVFLRGEMRMDSLDALAAGLFAWLLLSVLWTPDPKMGMEALTRFGPAVLLFLVLRRIPSIRNIAAPAAVLGMLFGLLASVEYAGMGNPTFLVEGLAVLSLLCFGTPVGVAIGLAGLVAVLTVGSLIAKLIVAVWAFVWLFLAFRSVWGRSALVGFGLLAVVLVLVNSVEAQIGIQTRLDLFASTAFAWADRFWFGWGVGSFNYILPAYGNVGVGLIPYSVESSTFPGAAHNDFLQLAMEGGVVALGIALAGVWLILRGSAGINRTALLTFLGLSLVGFAFQNPVALVGAVLAASAIPPSGKGFMVPGRLVGATAAVFCLVLVTSLPSRAVSEAHFSATLRHLSAATHEDANPLTAEFDKDASPVAALFHANEAYKLAPWRFETRLALFQAATLSNQIIGLPKDDQIEEAWRIAQTASPLNPSMLLARLGYLGRNDRCPEECEPLVAILLGTAWRKQEVQWLVDKAFERTGV